MDGPTHIDSQQIVVRELREHEFDTYAAIHCKGTGLSEKGIPYVSKNNKVLYNRPGWHFFIAEWNQMPCAVAVMYIHQTTASLTFAATLPEYRGQGLHTALILERIKKAKQEDCQLIVGQTSYASQSYRNMEKAGMKLGYTRATWTELEGGRK